MTKLVVALIVAGAAGWSFTGSATGAPARQVYPGCCGPASATTMYRTVQPQLFVTRHHDVSVYDRVNRVRRIVDVTRIRPIIRVHEVTRVYHHTIVRSIDAYDVAAQPVPSVSYAAQPLPSIDYVYPSVGYQPGCGCTW